MGVAKLASCFRNFSNVVVVISMLLSQTVLPAQSVGKNRSMLERDVIQNPSDLVENGLFQGIKTTNPKPPQPTKKDRQALVPQDTLASSAGKLLFVENRGQFDPEVLFRLTGNGATIDVTRDSLWISIIKTSEEGNNPTGFPDNPLAGPTLMSTPSPEEKESGIVEERVNLRIHYQGNITTSNVVGIDPLQTKMSYFIGNDPEKWLTGVPTYGGVRFEDILTGKDLEITGENGALRQTLIAKGDAGGSQQGRMTADQALDVEIEGAENVDLSGSEYLIFTELGDFAFPKVETSDNTQLQDEQPTLAEPKVNPAIIPANRNRQEAVIDFDKFPEDYLSFSTFFGGALYDIGRDVYVDSNSNIYLMGNTESVDLPQSSGYSLYQPAGEQDIFIAKFGPSASSIEYVTYLGGMAYDIGNSMAVGNTGKIYLTGYTISDDFPVTDGSPNSIPAFDPTYNNGASPFIVRLSSSLDNLDYSSFYGNGQGQSIALDVDGGVYVAGQTPSSDFPVTSGAFDETFNGSFDGFIVKFNDTFARVYSSLIGGVSSDCERSGDLSECQVAVNNEGEAYIFGMTYSDQFSYTGSSGTPYQPSKNDGSDLFLMKISDDGSAVEYFSYLGGEGDEINFYPDIKIDENNYIYFNGSNSFGGFPNNRQRVFRRVFCQSGLNINHIRYQRRVSK